MKQAFFYALIFPLIFFFACKKDPKIVNAQTPPTHQVIDGDTADFTCKPFVYFQTSPRDSDITAHCVYQWQYNPANLQEIIYCLTNGQLWSYNLSTLTRKYLADNCVSMFETNKKGWIVFNKLDWNVYKVKSNGDSLSQLTFDGKGLNPHWDYSDTAIYCFTGSQQNLMMKLNAKGKKTDSLINGGLVESYSKISNKRAYLKSENGSFSLMVMDMSTHTETVVAHSSIFSNLAFDNTDQYLYYQNDSTLLKVNIQSQQSETVMKNCPNNGFGITGYSYGIDKLLLSWEKITALPKQYHDCYLHEWRSFEYNESNPTRKLHEIKIYPTP